MDFTEKLPEWKNAGTEPSDTLKNTGWKAFDYPAASVFNWQWYRTYKAMSEMQTKLSEIKATANELNKLKGTTATTDDFNKLNGITASADDLSLLQDLKNQSDRYVEMANESGDDYEYFLGVTAATIAGTIYDVTNMPYLRGKYARDGGILFGAMSKETAIADGNYCNSLGYFTHANAFQTVVGKYNIIKEGGSDSSKLASNGESLFIVGNGTYSSTMEKVTESNAFRVAQNGNCYGTGAWQTSGAGLAEMYEWVDGNSNNEDRRGLFITLDGDKIRVATPKDDYILGVVDPCPFVVGDAHTEEWKDMYLTDVFGTKLTEFVDVPEMKDKNGKIIPAHKEEQYILNPDYDPEKEYISREYRSEFATITSKGKVVMVDDGSCKVNSYCTVGEGGIATASENNYAVRVLERIDDTHIRVLVDSVFINK